MVWKLSKDSATLINSFVKNGFLSQEQKDALFLSSFDSAEQVIRSWFFLDAKMIDYVWREARKTWSNQYSNNMHIFSSTENLLLEYTLKQGGVINASQTCKQINITRAMFNGLICLQKPFLESTYEPTLIEEGILCRISFNNFVQGSLTSASRFIIILNPKLYKGVKN